MTYSRRRTCLEVGLELECVVWVNLINSINRELFEVADDREFLDPLITVSYGMNHVDASLDVDRQRDLCISCCRLEFVGVEVIGHGVLRGETVS